MFTLSIKLKYKKLNTYSAINVFFIDV